MADARAVVNVTPASRPRGVLRHGGAPPAPHFGSREFVLHPVSQVRGRTGFVCAALALLTAGFVITRTGRDALYFQASGIFGLPYAYLGIAALSLPMAGIILGMMRGLGPRAARVVAPVGAALVLVAFRPLAQPGGGAAMTALFLFVPLVFGVLFSLSWLLAADLLEHVERPARAGAYGVIGAASMAGGVLGGVAAHACAGRIGAGDYLLLGALLLGLASAVMAAAHARYPLAPPGNGSVAAGGSARAALGPHPSTVWPLLRQRYVGLLLLTGMLASLAGILVEFQFYLAAATSGRGTADQVRFFASFYIFLNSAALIVQLLLLPRLTRRFGIQGALLVLPAALAGGASVLLASATFVTRAALRVAEGGLKSSIHRASWEQAFLPLEPGDRAVAKLLVDGAGARVAEGLAAGALWVWLHAMAGGSVMGRSTAWVSWSLLGCTVGWILLTRRLGRQLDRLERSGMPAFRIDVPLPDT